MADTAQVKEITKKLEQGVKDLFESDGYADYLKTMSRFHSYSTRNTLLIHLQMPDASHVAGFGTWQKKFERHVMKGAKSIKILAPSPLIIREEKEKLDPSTRQPVLDDDGMPVVEMIEKQLARFKVVSVFDVSQTDGKPIPSLAKDLTGNVEQYAAFMDALREVSALPVVFERMPEDTDGICYFGDRIAIREGMSEIQTVSAVIHEMAHAKLHDIAVTVGENDKAKPKDSHTEEVEAESISYAVCQYFGIETGENSFGYLASWSRGKELKELNASLDTIRKTSAELIDAVDGRFQEIVNERGIMFAVGEEQISFDTSIEEQAVEQSEPEASAPAPRQYYITERQREQAERMAAKWDARADAFFTGGEGWGYDTSGYCKTVEEAEQATKQALKIHAAISSLISGDGTWADVQVIQSAVSGRDELDAHVAVRQDEPSIAASDETASNEGEMAVEAIDGVNNEASQFERQQTVDAPQPDPIRERLAALSHAETADEKYEIAFAALVDALCANEELLAVAATGAQWQRGTGRAAVIDGGHYETLIGVYSEELSDMLSDESMTNRLRNTVVGEAYRRLDAIAYDRYILDEYADITKSGRLYTYETPYPEDSESTGIMVHLTEQLPDGGVHDYGAIFGYDPNDKNDHAINNYLSLKSFDILRESVFGKSESVITLKYKETEPIGSTVLRRLLYTDGMFNREMKRSRVEVLPPMGKYSVYAQHLKGVIGDDTYIHIGTDSDYLLPLGVSRTSFDERYVEAQIDSIFEKAPKLLDDALADPEKFARFDWAAITGRFEEVEQHNIVYKSIKAEKDRIKREEISAREAADKKEAKTQYIEQFKMNADIIESGGSFKVEAMVYSGKNNLLELFTLYDVDVPLATKGWFNQKLISFEESANGGYSYRSYQNKGRKTSYMGDAAYNKLGELRNAIKAMPIAEKLAQKGLIIDAEQNRPAEQDNQTKNGGEDMQYPESQQTPSLTPDDEGFWRGQIAAFLASNDGKMELDDLELSPAVNHGGLGKFYEVFGKNTYKREFATIVAEENTRRTGEPWVVFKYCEGGEYRPDFLRTPSAMLFAEADAFIRGYEPKVREILDGGYDKLDITVFVKRDDNEVYPISDRYDVGDSKNVSGLYNTLNAEAGYYYAHPEIYGYNPDDEGFMRDKELTYADLAILKKAVTATFPYVEVENVVRYADGDKLDQRVFIKGDVLPFDEMDSKVMSEEKAIRDKNMRKHGSPGDGDEELSLAIHFKMPGGGEQGVHRFSYLLGDYDGERSGLLKHLKRGADYFNLCIREGDYGNINAMLGNGGGKTPYDAIRLASDYEKMYETLRGGMADIPGHSALTSEKPKAPEPDLLLPDPSWTVPEMIESGYTQDDMYPLSVGRALELFDSGHTIYLLNKDNTEDMAFDRDEIITHSGEGFCGITKADWEMSPVFAAQKAIAENSEGRREAELLHNDGDMFGIYQIKGGREMREYILEANVRHKDSGVSAHRGNYELAHTMPISDAVEPITDKADFLNQIRETFSSNTNSGCSVAMGDVIVLNLGGEITSHYVDRAGYKDLPSFTGEETPAVETPAQTYSQLGNTPAAPTVAELKAEVDAGKAISLTDLAKAVHAERQNAPRPAAPKGRPKLDDLLSAGRRGGTQQDKQNAHKKNNLEV